MNSNEQNERVFRTDELEAFESAAASETREVDVGHTLSFVPESDVTTVARAFAVNETHETIIPGSVFRYQTPDRGALRIVFTKLGENSPTSKRFGARPSVGGR